MKGIQEVEIGKMTRANILYKGRQAQLEKTYVWRRRKTKRGKKRRQKKEAQAMNKP